MMKKFVFLHLIAIMVLFIDQSSKFHVFQFLDANNINSIEIFPWLNFIKTWNRGVSFSMFNQLEQGPLIFVILTMIIIAILLVIYFKTEEKLASFAIALIISGALGNLIDRMRFGAVADFIDVYYKDYHWPTFNMADSFICIGVALMILGEIFFNGKKNEV